MSNTKESTKPTGLKRKLIIGIVTVILIVMMFPKGESIEFEVSEGAIWTNDDRSRLMTTSTADHF